MSSFGSFPTEIARGRAAGCKSQLQWTFGTLGTCFFSTVTNRLISSGERRSVRTWVRMGAPSLAVRLVRLDAEAGRVRLRMASAVATGRPLQRARRSTNLLSAV